MTFQESDDESARFDALRLLMVEEQLARRKIQNPKVLKAMASIPRHLFVPESERHLAYRDMPLPIGWEQTISQPYIVALMTQLAAIDEKSRVLEIGTGSGYQAAILSSIAAEVYSLETLSALSKRSKEVFRRLGIKNVHQREGDGFLGWQENAPYDGILVTSAPPEIPTELIEQLAVFGHMVIPVGKPNRVQQLKVVSKQSDGSVASQDVAAVQFVPMKPL
jgi:protein-L-isoaspartate(D-aspartate) O-methyltransferase